MPLLKAHKVSFFLASGGFHSVKKIGEISLDEMIKMREEPGSRTPEILRQSGYKAKDAEDGSVLVTFHGSERREETMLRLYRTVLDNCGYQVEETEDASRPRRRMLRVVT